jgi:hypothetical protein
MACSALRLLTTALLVGSTVALQAQSTKRATPPVAAKVYLSPTCGCCGKWADHMKAAGFAVTREVTAELDSVPARTRVPERLRSCHTAVIENYLVEGHIPADVVRQLLKERPRIVGIAAPGMPLGSPGMESPNPQPYVIVAFRADGTGYEFARR